VHRCEFERPAHALTGVAPYDSGRSPLRSAGRRRYKIPLERKRRTAACPLLLCGFLLARYYVNPSADVRLPAFLRVVISIVARRLRSVAYTCAVHVVLILYIYGFDAQRSGFSSSDYASVRAADERTGRRGGQRMKDRKSARA